MRLVSFQKFVTLGLMVGLLALSLFFTGCGNKEIALHEVTVQGTKGNLVISLPFDFRKPGTPQNFPNGSTVNSTADHDSDFEVTINSVHYDREKFKAANGVEFKPDLASSSDGILKSFRNKFSATGGQLEDYKIAGLPAKMAILDRTSKDIKLKMKFVTFFKGDELWCITIAYKADDKDFEQAANKMLESIRIE